MGISAMLSFFIGKRINTTWAVGLAPHSTHSIISRMITVGKSWQYMMSLTTFILTFFLNQAYAHWREMYKAARSIQGRLNDVNLLLATFATRNEDDGQYTPEAEAVLDSVASYTRLFHAFNWAKHASAFNVLLSPRGMSRMLSRGLMTQSEFNALQAIDQKAGAQNACLEWIIIRSFKGMEDGAIKDDVAMKHVFLDKITILRGKYAGIGDLLDGRMPLAYTHFVQVLVDTFLALAPFALYPELGVWAVLSVG